MSAGLLGADPRVPADSVPITLSFITYLDDISILNAGWPRKHT
jgi:hypothetical protein